MHHFDVDALLRMLRDPNCETAEIAQASGAPREAAGRAARLVLGIAKAKPEDLVSLPTPLALAVLQAAEGAGRADLLAAAAGHPSKDVAKDGKRRLYVLKTRGVAVPELPRATPPPPVAVPEPPLPCFASSVDGRGERALWIARSVPGKGIEVAQAVVSDVRGLADLHLGVLGRKEFRAFCRDLVERGRTMGVAEIDREAAKSLAAAARELTRSAGGSPPEGADAWLSRLGPAAPPADPAVGFAALPEPEERAAVEGSARLHDLPLLRGWLADEEGLRAVARKLDEIAVSSLYLDERQRAEASLRAVEDAVATVLDGPWRERWASRLFAAAEHLQRAGDPAHARVAAATARALRAGASPQAVPFARRLVEKAFPAPAEPAALAPPPPGAAPGALIVPPPR
jgi:hypothetical protein